VNTVPAAPSATSTDAVTRIIAGAVCLVLIDAAQLLIFYPGRTNTLWAWDLKPEVTAMTLGSVYAGGAYFFGRLTFGAPWRSVAAGFPAVWCLGVLCTTPERPALLRELRRVLADDGDLGLLVFERRRARLHDTPEGNDFPTSAELERQLRAAGLVAVARVGCDELAPAPPSWGERADRVQAAVAAAHGNDPRFRAAQDQQRRIADLLADGEISGELVHARRFP